MDPVVFFWEIPPGWGVFLQFEHVLPQARQFFSLEDMEAELRTNMICRCSVLNKVTP